MKKRIRKKLEKRNQEQLKIAAIQITVAPVKEVKPQYNPIVAEDLIKGLEVRFKDETEKSYLVQRVAKDKTWADIATDNGNKRIKDPLEVFVK